MSGQFHGTKPVKLRHSIRYGNQDLSPSGRRPPDMAPSEAAAAAKAGAKKVSKIRTMSEDVRRQIEAGVFEDAGPEKILRWAIDHFHPRLALSASFGAPEGMALLPGPIISQNWLWFQSWLILLKIPDCATALAS